MSGTHDTAGVTSWSSVYVWAAVVLERLLIRDLDVLAKTSHHIV